MAKIKRKSKKITKKSTQKSAPKRKYNCPEKKATQLQVLVQAREYFGKKFPDQVILMSELDNTVPGYISTQSLALDWIMGNGGAPQSRIIDFSGDHGVGKSTAGDHLMAEVQRRGGHAWLWDTENARDDRYQKEVGVVRKAAGQITSQSLEDGFELMIELIDWHSENDPNRLGIILWDTPAGTPTRAERDPDKKDERFGPAKIIRSYLRKLNQHLQRSRWILCVVNQTYLGQNPSGQTYKAVFGGGGVPFYSSVRLSFTHPSKFWKSDTDKKAKLPPIGQTVWVSCSKNRVGVPHRSKQLCIIFGKGISNEWEVFDVLSGSGCLKLSGSWYSFDESGWPELAEKYPKSFQGGFMSLVEMIKETPGLWEDLLKAYHDIQDAL